jgi:hypothetical protein
MFYNYGMNRAMQLLPDYTTSVGDAVKLKVRILVTMR